MQTVMYMYKCFLKFTQTYTCNYLLVAIKLWNSTPSCSEDMSWVEACKVSSIMVHKQVVNYSLINRATGHTIRDFASNGGVKVMPEWSNERRRENGKVSWWTTT